MKILSILTTSKDELKKKQAARKAKALKRRQETLIDKLEDERDNMIAKQEELENITVDTVKEETWCKEYQEQKVNLIMKNKEIEIAKDTLKEMFTE